MIRVERKGGNGHYSGGLEEWAVCVETNVQYKGNRKSKITVALDHTPHATHEIKQVCKILRSPPAPKVT